MGKKNEMRNKNLPRVESVAADKPDTCTGAPLTLAKRDRAKKTMDNVWSRLKKSEKFPEVVTAKKKKKRNKGASRVGVTLLLK